MKNALPKVCKEKGQSRGKGKRVQINSDNGKSCGNWS